MIAWVYYILLLALYLTGLLLNILGLPGLWLMVTAHAVFGWATGWGVYVGWPSLLILVGLGLCAEIVEFVAGAAGSKSAGGSRRSMAGAITGGFVGGIAFTFLVPIPVVGSILGALVGSAIGASGLEVTRTRDWRKLTRVGIGAAKGRLIGIIAKTGFGIAMFIVGATAAAPLGAMPLVAPQRNLPATASTTAAAS